MIDEDAVLRFAQLGADALWMNDAALAGDFDEARFRAHLINDQALSLGLSQIAEIAGQIARLLGPTGTDPLPGYGVAMLKLANALTPRIRPNARTS